MAHIHYSDEMMRVFLDYYSFDDKGTKTISIHHIGEAHCEYAILQNGGVATMIMGKEDVERASRLCIEMGITISPTIIR